MTDSQRTELAGDVARLLSGPLPSSWQFWLFLALGVVGLVVSGAGWWYSYRAFREASDAKTAAEEAAKRTKVYIDATVLAEAIEKFARQRRDMSFQDVFSLLLDIAVPIARMLATFDGLSDIPPEIHHSIAWVRAACADVWVALEGVTPYDGETNTAKHTIYYTTQPLFAKYRLAVADLHGRLDKLNIPELVRGTDATR